MFYQEKEKGFKRAWLALINSCIGLRTAFKYEGAMRMEAFLFVFFLGVIFFSDKTKIEILLLISSMFGVLVAELLNTAVEYLVDRVSIEYNLLSKAAKDVASAAVFLAMIYFLIVWISIFYDEIEFLFSQF